MKSIGEELQALDDYLKLKNYSVATRKSYGCALKQFLHWRIKKGVSDLLDQIQARQYILHRYDQGLKWQSINGDYSAMLRYFRDVKKLLWDVEHIPRPRKERQLPRIISKDVERTLYPCHFYPSSPTQSITSSQPQNRIWFALSKCLENHPKSV